MTCTHTPLGADYCPTCIREKHLKLERQRVLALLANQMNIHHEDKSVLATLTALKEALEGFEC